MEKTDILIIGGGPAGIMASHYAKKVNKNLKITLVKDEKGVIIRCSEPYVIGGSVDLNEIIHPDDKMIESKGIDLLIDKITEIDYKKKVATSKNKKEILFDKLILATGAHPFVPPIKGKDLENVFTLRSEEDTRNLKKISNEKKRAVIIGGGGIGIEIAALLRKKGLEVSIVELLPHLLSMAYDPEFSKKIEDVLGKGGIKVFTDQKVKSIEGEGKVDKVLVGDEKIPADFVIVATGVRSNMELAKNCGCDTGKFGIKIDDYCQTSLEDVYACGDCSQFLGFITGEPIPSKLATTAVIEGKVAGMNAAGKREKIPGIINPSVTTFFNFASGRVGITEKEANKEGIGIISGYGKATNKYPSQKGVEFVENKLIFNKDDGILIGAQVFGGKEGIDERIDLLSLAIHKKLTIEDLRYLGHCAHPELSPLPFAEPIVIATEDALNKKR